MAKFVSDHLYKNLFYFDIETSGKYRNLDECREQDPEGFKLFVNKYERKIKTDLSWNYDLDQVYLDKSAIFAEFGNIVCVSIGLFRDEDNFEVKSYTGDEKDMMEKIQRAFIWAEKNDKILSGYNIKSFDIPWLNKKFYKYGLQIPNILSTFGKKPWEMRIIDLFDIWKSTTIDYPTFEEMFYDLGLENIKGSFDGDQVHKTYWNGGIEIVREYCENEIKMMMEAGKKIVQKSF